ncbi:MAG: undecaprenyl-diphosphatase UppP [Pirellulales bacterium]
MTLLEAIVLAVVQGLTEFLPISSTAHLRVVPALLGWDDPGAAFSAVIQIGTLAAVLTYFWRDVLRILTAMLADLRGGKLATTHDAALGWMIAAGTIPIVVCGLLFKDAIETTLRSLYVVSVALVIVSVLLVLVELVVRRRIAAGEMGRDVGELTWRDAIVVGFAQAAALIPGTSRSGATIFGGLTCGLSREAAARYSFLLSIPSVFAAGLYQLIKAREELLASQDEVVNLVAALVVSAAVGYATIPWLLGFLRTHSTFVFIVYRLLLAGVLLALLTTDRLSPNDGDRQSADSPAAAAAALPR